MDLNNCSRLTFYKNFVQIEQGCWVKARFAYAWPQVVQCTALALRLLISDVLAHHGTANTDLITQ
jgi:hypothetical protein